MLGFRSGTSKFCYWNNSVRSSLAVILVAVLLALLVSPAWPADIEYDAINDTLILHTPAAIKLMEMLRDNESMQDTILNMAREIQKRAEESASKDNEINALNRTIRANEKAVDRADYIMATFDSALKDMRALIAEERESRKIERDGYQAIIGSYQEQLKESRSELRWARATSLVGIILAVFTLGSGLFH